MLFSPFLARFHIFMFSESLATRRLERLDRLAFIPSPGLPLSRPISQVAMMDQVKRVARN
jgi:hypothetical protein